MTTQTSSEEDRIALDVEAASMPLDLTTAVPLGIIVNELVLNCCEHAFPGGRRGHIAVSLSADVVDLVVEDDGVSMVRDNAAERPGQAPA